MIRMAVVVSLTGFILACGGSGGGSSPPANQLPTANAGVDQTVDENVTVTLTGAASSDADGTIATYAWTQIFGTVVALAGSTTSMATFTSPMITTPETLTFQLTVTDNTGASGVDTVVISILDSTNQSPVANAGNDQTVNEGQAVTLDGSMSNDPDGPIASYAWTQTAGPNVTLANTTTPMPTFSAQFVNANTIVTFELTITDAGGLSSTDSVSVTITDLGNLPPTAATSGNSTVNENTLVTLDGSTSNDSDGSIVSYAWTQTVGPNVNLNGANTAMATFTSPTVMVDTTLTFSLTVTDDLGSTGTDTVDVIVSDVAVNVSISGKVTYDHVPHNLTTSSLNYFGTTQDPIRGATVQALDVNNIILATTKSNGQGDYSLVVAPNTMVRIRVWAEIIQVGPPTWDVRVVDNTSGGAVYTLVGSLTDSGAANGTRNLNAASGWSVMTNSYSNPRASAPFAILESIYEAITGTALHDPMVVFPAVLANWSVNNIPSDCAGGNADGCISTSSYDGTGIFILGAANNDTDEFDGHVIVHEWGHYFEDKLSRSDSTGGSHGGGDVLDIRIAFGEGFGNGLSGIITGDPFYRDSSGNAQGSGFDINVESNNTEGWFGEATVQAILYDLFDESADGAGDSLKLGWGVLYDTFVSAEYKETEARVSIHAYLARLKADNASSAAAITSLASARNVNGTDVFGAGESFLPPGANNGADILPIYSDIVANGVAVQVCSANEFGTFNRLSNRQFLKLNITNAATYGFQTSGAGDPDLVLYKNANLVNVFEVGGNENATQALTPGIHVIEAYDYCNIDPTDTGCPANGNTRTCINVTVTQL